MGLTPASHMGLIDTAVRLERPECRAVGVDGSLPEGALVHVLQNNAESCLDWSFVIAEDQETWVRDKYLASDPPAPGGSSRGCVSSGEDLSMPGSSSRSAAGWRSLSASNRSVSSPTT